MPGNGTVYSGLSKTYLWICPALPENCQEKKRITIRDFSGSFFYWQEPGTETLRAEKMKICPVCFAACFVAIIIKTGYTVCMEHEQSVFLLWKQGISVRKRIIRMSCCFSAQAEHMHERY
jgi:hypothetical protein